MGSGYPGGLFPAQYSQGGTLPQEFESVAAMVMTPRAAVDIIDARGCDVVRVTPSSDTVEP
jgi:hypothetical protein